MPTLKTYRFSPDRFLTNPLTALTVFFSHPSSHCPPVLTANRSSSKASTPRPEIEPSSGC